MYIASTVNSSSRSGNDVPVVVLSFGKESCLVKVPFAYQDLNDSTKRVFGVEGPFIFKTSTLDICQGRTVAIHESAWESVRSFVAELQVTLANGKEGDNTKHIPYGEAEPVPSASKTPEAQGKVPSRNVPHEELDELEYANLPEDKDDIEQLGTLTLPAGSAVSSDDGHEPNGSERSVRNSPVAFEHYATDDEDDDDDVASATADHIKTEPARSERPSVLGQYVDKDLSDVGSNLGSQEMDEQPADPPVKAEQLSVRGLRPTSSQAPIKSSQSQTQPDADDEDPKYVISVAYRPTGEESMFKTRGTYSVKKVLARACQTFDLDFDRAHLKLIVELEDEEGELLSDCDNGDTMARAGATENSRFIIVLDDI